MFKDIPVDAKFLGTTHNQTVLGKVIIREYDEAARNKRMLSIGLKAFGGAVASIFLPIIHFILVPGFIIGGIFAVLMVGRAKEIYACEAKCPECGVDFKIAKGKVEFPKTDYCASCHHKIEITISEPVG